MATAEYYYIDNAEQRGLPLQAAINLPRYLFLTHHRTVAKSAGTWPQGELEKLQGILEDECVLDSEGNRFPCYRDAFKAEQDYFDRYMKTQESW